MSTSLIQAQRGNIFSIVVYLFEYLPHCISRMGSLMYLEYLSVPEQNNSKSEIEKYCIEIMCSVQIMQIGIIYFAAAREGMVN